MHDTLTQLLISHFGSLEDVPEELQPLLDEINQTLTGSPVQEAAEAVYQSGIVPRSEFRFSNESVQEKGGNGRAGGSLAIPIQLRGRTLGAINLDFADQDTAHDSEPLIQQLTGRLALAMDNARLFQETQGSLARTNALLEVSRAAIAYESTADLLEKTAGIINRTLNCDRVVIRRLDARRKEILEAVGAGPGVQLSPLDLPFNDLMDGLHGWVLAERTPALSPKNTPDPRDSEKSRELRANVNSGAILIVPLMARSAVTGMITAINTPDEPDFTEQDQDLVVAMANQITTALENAQLVEEQQRRLQELSVLFEGSRIFSTAPTSLTEAAVIISRYFLDTSGADTSAVGIYRPDEQALDFLAETARENDSVSVRHNPSRRNYALSADPFTRRVLEQREAASISVRAPGIRPEETSELKESGVKTRAVIPMASKGEVFGVIELFYRLKTRALGQEQLDYFTTLANQAASTLDNLQLLQSQQQRALELQTAAEVSEAASSILDPDELLPQTVELIRDRFNLYYAGIFLVDEAGEWAVLRAGSGEAGKAQIEQHHRLRVGGRSMIGRCIATAEAQIASDIGEAAVHFNNPVLPDTRSELALPLVSRGERLGAMTIQSTQPAVFNNENITTLRTMADQLANSIENARLYAQAQIQNVELDRLNEMGRELTSKFDRSAIVETIHDFTSQLMEFNSFLLSFYDSEKEQLSFPIVVENGKRLSIPDQPLGSGLIAYAIRNRTPLLIPDHLEETAERLGIIYTTVGQTTESWLGVPMFAGDEIFGVISVQSTTTPGLYNERSRDLLISIANQASNALQITALFEQAQQQTDELAVLNEMSRELSIQLDIDNVVENVYTYATRLLETPNLFVALYDGETESIDFKLAVTDEGKRLEVPARNLGSGLTDYVIHTRTPLLFKDNAQAEIDRMGLEGITIGDPPLSWLAVPIILGDDVIGVIGTQSVTTAGKFNERHRDLLQSIAGQAAIALQNASLFRQAQQQTDDLAVLNEMSRELSTQLETPRIVEKVYEYAARLIDTPDVFIALFDPETNAISFPYAVDDGKRIEVPSRIMNSGLTDYVIRNQGPLVINENANQVFQEMGIDSVLIGEQPESWLGVPILLGDRSLGMIGSQSVGTARRYSPRQVELVTSIAGQAAITLQNAALFDRAQRQNEELLVLNEMSRVLTTLLDVDRVVETIYEYTSKLMDTTSFFVAFYDPGIQQVTFPLVVTGGERYDRLSPRQLGTGLTDYVLRSETPLLMSHFSEEKLAELGIELILFGDDKPAQSWLGVPMLIGSTLLGAIVLQSTSTPGLFTARHRDLLTAIANQASNAIQNARLFSQTQRQNNDLAVLNEMSRVLASALTVEQVVTQVYEYASRVLDTSVFQVVLYDDAEQSIRYPMVMKHGERLYVPARPFGDQGLMEHVISSRRPVLFKENVPEEMEKLGLQTVTLGGEDEPLCWMGVPMTIGPQVIGAISVQSTSTPGLFGEYERDLLTSIGGQAAIAIQNARLFGEAQKRASQLLTAAEVARDASESLNLDELLPRAVDLIRDRFGFYHASIFLLDDTRQSAYVRASTGEAGKAMIDREHRLEVGSKSIIGTVTHTGEPLVINDVTQDVIHRPNPLLPDTRAELGIPLKVGERVIGALDVQSTEPHAFTSDDIAVLHTLSDQIAVAVDNSKTFELAQAAFQAARERAQEMTTLYDVSRELTTSALEIREIVEAALRSVTNTLGEDVTSSISLFEEESGMMRTVADQDLDEKGVAIFIDDPSSSDFLLADYPATARAMESRTARFFDRNDEELDAAEKAYLEKAGAFALFVIPLDVKGRSLGVLEIETWKEDKEVSREQRDLLIAMANQAAGAIENAQLYEEQIRTTEQLRELDTLKNQFLANMSHELRTPLNSIIGFSRVILKGIDGPVSDLQQQDLTAIYNAGQHLLGLINDILDLSRIEAGKMEVNFEDIDLESLITSVMATARGLVKEKPIRLDQEVDEDLPLVRADATRVRQILLNLLQNAAKFTDEGFIRVSATSESNDAGEHFVRVSVADSGIGIAPGDQEKLFQPFTQVDSSTTRKVGGTGLGLSISRNLITLHGGEIGVNSEPDQGSTFYFTLPIVAEGDDEYELDGRNVVLALNDDPHVIGEYGRYLESRGFQVIPLDDPEKAIDVAVRLHPSAVTLDVSKPNGNGWQVIQRLKAHEATRNIPIIFTTMVDDQARGFSMAASDYLLKPVKEEELVSALARMEARREVNTVLTIGDDPDLLQTVEKTLQPAGAYTLILAEGGKQGIKMLKRNTVDVVLLDLLMHDLDGFKVLERMQRDPKFKQIPVIALTGDETREPVEDEVNGDASDPLRNRSLKEERLMDKIAEILRARNGSS